MSDEESFVILGTSPMSSLENDGAERSKHSITTSLQSDTPGSRFSSLKNSQINDLRNAQEIATQTPEENVSQSGMVINSRSLVKSLGTSSRFSSLKANPVSNSQSPEQCEIQPEMADPIMKKIKTPEIVPTGLMDNTKTQQTEISANKLWSRQPQVEINDNATPSCLEDCEIKSSLSLGREQEMAGSKLWSRQPQVQVEENMTPFSLEDCALKSPLEQQQQKSSESVEQTMTNSTNAVQLNQANKSTSNYSKTTPPHSVESNLATSFIMGEVNADVLKTSVYSQFPSISMEACAEDVVKLQNMVTEYSQLKTTIKRANNTMKQFYTNSLQWKDKMKAMEEEYKKELHSCQREIELLRKQNQELQSSFNSQIEALEIARKKDREETIKEVSEKNALLENMRAQIIKLEQQQLASYEFVANNLEDQKSVEFNKLYITRREHEREMKNLERQLSELLATNLDFKDIEKQYIDELNCLKVNLVAAEELIKKHRNEIDQLVALDIEKREQIQVLQKSLEEQQITNKEHIERISLLEHQNDVHRKDFEMEQESRQTAVKEKQQILQDLRNLQRKNQELIEEHQKIAQSYERKISSSGAGNTAQFTAAAAAAQSYLNNPQRPIRPISTAFPSSSSASPTTAHPPISLHLCPICNKAFKSLNILQSHVNDCIDKN